MPQSALVLGAGFVAAPCVEVLAAAGVRVTVACRTESAAQALVDRCRKSATTSKSTSTGEIAAQRLDVTDTRALEAAVAAHDVTVSLIPYTFHATVVEAAIKARKHVVTTSYVSPALQALDEQAKAAGITVMNEIGMDPGIDHLYAVDFIERVHKEGGKIRAFRSFVCGLPAPENSDNPLGYKFSWSSRGVLLALKNDARYLMNGKDTQVKGEDLMSTAKPYHTGFLGFSFVAYGNRDSAIYRERYSIPEAHTVIRGSMRYAGFPEFVKVLVDIGLLGLEEKSFLKEAVPWKEATRQLLGAKSASEADLVQAIESKTKFSSAEEKEQLMIGIKWLGILSDTKITPKGTPLDTLCATLEEKMSYEEGERDLVFLQHRFDVENKDGSNDVFTSTLCEYGAPIGSGGYLAMERLVGIPAGVATKQVLDGTIADKGILAPMHPKLNNPLMVELKKNYGIECKEKKMT